MPIRLDDLQGAGRERARRILAEDASTASAAHRPTQKQYERKQPQRERQLQADADRWLQCKGFFARTPTSIANGPPPLGWRIHIVKAEKNPLILDLLLLGNDGRWLEIELKTANGKTAKHQQQLLDQAPDQAVLCRSIEEVMAAVYRNWPNATTVAT